MGTILLLAALISVIMVPVFVGYALAAHATTYLLLGLAFMPITAVFLFLFSRVVARGDREDREAHGGH